MELAIKLIQENYYYDHSKLSFFMDRILIVSNRLPIQISKKHAALQIQPTSGGLATGVNSIHKAGNSLWIGWPGIYLQQKQADKRKQIVDLLSNERYHPVFLTPHEIKYYL